LLYGHVPDPFPWCGIGSGHVRLFYFTEWNTYGSPYYSLPCFWKEFGLSSRKSHCRNSRVVNSDRKSNTSLEISAVCVPSCSACWGLSGGTQFVELRLCGEDFYSCCFL